MIERGTGSSDSELCIERCGKDECSYRKKVRILMMFHKENVENVKEKKESES